LKYVCRKHDEQSDLAKSDELRDRLLAMGVKIYDTKEGTKYRI
jgi:cysteinyl-tRNA synthetase